MSRFTFATLVLAVSVLTGINQKTHAQSQFFFESPVYASTAEEGFARGIADLRRSTGLASLLHAQASTEYQNARSARISNDVASVAAYFERKRINHDARFGPDHVAVPEGYAEESISVHPTATRPAPPAAPTRLTAVELNSQTGQLHWPLLLRTEHFAKARRPVDEVFVRRAVDGEINPDHYVSLVKWIDRVQAELRKSIGDVPDEDYRAAASFLRRLINEARMPTSPDSLFESWQLAAK